MNILVTGGSGFIGSHVVDKLIEQGHMARSFDFLPPHRKDAEFFHGDLLDIAALMDAMKDVDVVFHLAAVSNVDIAKKNPILCVRVNSEGTVHVLEAARRTNVKRVIYASTVWVYENCKDSICTEESLLGSPSHIYTSTKLEGEFLCRNYFTMYGIPFTILRYGIPYGPRARKGTVIPIFVEKALRGEPLAIQGTGEQYRYFLHVEDLATGNALALNDIAKNQIYNLEGKEKVTIKQIAEAIQKNLANVTIQHLPARTADFPGKVISSEKAKKELGWEPKIDFVNGMRQYIEWFKSQKFF
jgi:UDP-glucose 4-epimerase